MFGEGSLVVNVELPSVIACSADGFTDVGGVGVVVVVAASIL